jgi:leucyl/phenylalanyl-tRNA--protein transferase
MASGKHGGIEFCAFPIRGIIPLDDRFTVRRSVMQAERKQQLKVTYDLNFEEVLRGCARHTTLPDEEVWLSEELMPYYRELHQRGIAHSVEVWKQGALVGGLYGLHLGSAFLGESMFSNAPYASQVALVHLVERLRKSAFTLLDAQMATEHLKQFGLYEIRHNEYMKLLEAALQSNAVF